MKKKRLKKEYFYSLGLFFVVSLLVLFLAISYNSRIVNLSPEGSIYNFINSVKNHPNNYTLVIPNNPSLNSDIVINNFAEKLGIQDIVDLSFLSKDTNLIFIGIINDFSDLKYNSYIQDNDAIAVYDNEKNSVYVYAKNVSSLEKITRVLYENKINYTTSSAIRIFDSELIYELFLEPIAEITRTISGDLEYFKEKEVNLDLNLKRDVSALIITDLVTNAQILTRIPETEYYTSDAAIWILENVPAGNYNFKYTLIPFASNVKIEGNLGLKDGDKYEIIYPISIYTYDFISTSNTVTSGSGGSSSNNFLSIKNLTENYISLVELINGVRKESKINSKIIFSIDYSSNKVKNMSFFVNSISTNKINLVIENISLYLKEGERVNLSLVSDRYDISIKIEEINSDNILFSIKRIYPDRVSNFEKIENYIIEETPDKEFNYLPYIIYGVLALIILATLLFLFIKIIKRKKGKK